MIDYCQNCNCDPCECLAQDDPVEAMFSRSFVTQRDADELRALDQQQAPTTRGKLLPNVPGEPK